MCVITAVVCACGNFVYWPEADFCTSIIPWQNEANFIRSDEVCIIQWRMENYISPGSQLPQVEARKRCSRDLFTFSGRATALIGRHFWHTILQQSMTRLTNTAILLTYTSLFQWRFSGNWQEHICECNIRCFGSPSHPSLGSDRLNVTVCRTCTVPLWDVQRTVGSWRYWKNILGWLAWSSSSSPHLYSTVLFGITF